MADVVDDPEFGELRADRRRNFAEVVRVLARYADWRDRTARPTWALLAEQAGVSRRTVARAIAWLHERGYLGTVETGSTPLLRIGVLYGLDAGEGNRAAEYVLCTPGRASHKRPIRQQPTRPLAVGRHGTGTPSGFCKEPRVTPAREDPPESPSPRHWPAMRRPQTRGEMLAAAELLRRRNPVLRRLTARHLRSLLKTYWAAGWTPADVLHVIDHLPDGRQYPHTNPVRHVAGWLRYRLAAWHVPGGGLHAPPSQLAADHAHRVRAEQAQRAAERAAARAARVDADTGPAAAARSKLSPVAAAHHRARRAAQAARAARRITPVRFGVGGSSVSSPVIVQPSRDCTVCDAALDPDGSCFVCGQSTAILPMATTRG